MGSVKLKIEGGQGGRRGHSNMAHWVSTEEINVSARIRRRREAKAIISRETPETVETPNQLPDPTSPSVTPAAGAADAPSVAADH
jgi:hypothetical protein